MSEHQKNPDPMPRGRHSQQPPAQGPAGAPRRSSARPQAAGRPQAQRQAAGRAQGQPQAAGRPRGERPQGQPQAAGHPQPQQGGRRPAPSSGAYRPQGQAQSGYRPRGQAPVQSPVGYRSPGQVPAGYRPQAAAASGYRPAPPAAGGYIGRPANAKPPKKKGGPWRVVFWVALVVLVVALAALGAIAFSYWQGQQSYDEVAEDVFQAPADVEGTSLGDLTVDWDALKAMNPDTVGWVYIPGTPVNYPIVHTTDDEKYLTYDFNGKQTWGATYGTIFLSAANKGDFTDANNIIYGHHLNNGSMFACIADMIDPATFEEHRTVYVLTPQGNYKLRTFSLMHVAADDPLVQTDFADDAELAAYAQDKLDRGAVVAQDAPQAADLTHMFAFATCDGLPTDGRYVLFASVVETTVQGAGDADAQGTDTADPDAAGAIDDAAKEAVS